RAPRLTVPGSRQFQTQPDGLWLTWGIPRGRTSSDALYADCVVVEACGSYQNLYDKRSRYAARTTSLEVDVRKVWLDKEVVIPGHGGPARPRRELLGGRPLDDQLIPVRNL